MDGPFLDALQHARREPLNTSQFMKIHEISSGMVGPACHNDPDILPLNQILASPYVYLLTLMIICEIFEKYERKNRQEYYMIFLCMHTYVILRMSY